MSKKKEELRTENAYFEHPETEGRRAKSGSKWKKVLVSVVVLVLALLLLGAGLVWAKLNGIDRIGDENQIDASEENFEIDPNAGLDTLADADINFTETQVFKDKDVVNIMLIGRDNRNEERGRSDAMILLSLNRTTKEISMVSLMRDAYVQIPGYSNNKMNAAFAFGGYELMDQTIEQNYGVHIDYNVGVSFDGFKQVIDELGGIQIELNRGEVKYIENEVGKCGLREGVNLLNGEQALSYARARYVSTGKEANDFGRTYRQRVVMMAVYKEMMKKPLAEIWKLLDPIMDCIETDMSNLDIISLGTEFYNMNIQDLNSYRLPMDGEFTDEKVKGMSVLVLDMDRARAHLQEWLYHPEGESTPSDF